MTRSLSWKAAAAATVALLTFAGCNSTSSSVVPAQPTNLSGDYTGTVQDSVGGTGDATATLAQHGTSAGGAISDVEGGGTITFQADLSISASNSVSGAMVVDYGGGGPTCTYSTTGTYDPGTNVLSGSYSAVTNCSGESGTYALTQACHDTITGSDRRTLGNPKC